MPGNNCHYGGVEHADNQRHDTIARATDGGRGNRTTTMRNSNIQELEPLSVTVQQAARLLGLSDRKSVYALIRRGDIKARKSGRMFLVSYASLKKYVEG